MLNGLTYSERGIVVVVCWGAAETRAAKRRVVSVLDVVHGSWVLPERLRTRTVCASMVVRVMRREAKGAHETKPEAVDDDAKDFRRGGF